MLKMYDELASWWPLLSAPEDYEEEAAFYGAALADACDRPPRLVLELGSGGGNNASHLKARFQMVLVEPSQGMRRVSEALNPECGTSPATCAPCGSGASSTPCSSTMPSVT